MNMLPRMMLRRALRLLRIFLLVYISLIGCSVSSLMCYKEDLHNGQNCSKICVLDMINDKINPVTGCIFHVEDALQICKSSNRHLVGQSNLKIANQYCYICDTDFCNHPEKVTWDNRSAFPVNEIQEENNPDSGYCYICNSTNFEDCNNKTTSELCNDTYTCYSKFENGVYQQGCRPDMLLDPDKCDEINKEPNSHCELCLKSSCCCNKMINYGSEQNNENGAQDSGESTNEIKRTNEKHEQRSSKNSAVTFNTTGLLFLFSIVHLILMCVY